MSVRITTSGLERLTARIKAKSEELGEAKMRARMNDAAKQALEAYRVRIASFKPGDVPDLKPATKKTKAKQVGFFYPILKRTGALLASMYPRVLHGDGDVWTLRIGFRGTRAGGLTNAELARIHLEGLGNNPVRDFTKLSEQWRRNFLQRLRRSLWNK